MSREIMVNMPELWEEWGLMNLSFQDPEEAGDGEGLSYSSAECERYSYPMGCA